MVPWAATLWSDVGEPTLDAASAHLQKLIVEAGRRGDKSVYKAGHLALALERGDGEAAKAFDEEHAALQPLLEAFRQWGLEVGVVAAVGYWDARLSVARYGAVADHLEAICERSAADNQMAVAEAAREALVHTHAWPCFRPHADRLRDPRQGATFAVAMRARRSFMQRAESELLAAAVAADADVSVAAADAGAADAKAVLERLRRIFERLDSNPFFSEPRTEPLAFWRSFDASGGRLVRPSAGVAAAAGSGGRPAAVFDAAAQLPDHRGHLCHYRAPPPGGRRMGEVSLTGREAGEASLHAMHQGVRQVFDEGSELSFVCAAISTPQASDAAVLPRGPRARATDRSRLACPGRLGVPSVDGERAAERAHRAGRALAGTRRLPKPDAHVGRPRGRALGSHRRPAVRACADASPACRALACDSQACAKGDLAGVALPCARRRGAGR